MSAPALLASIVNVSHIGYPVMFLLVMAESSGVLEKVLLVVAVAFGTINVIGGFLVTDRMLEMFKGRDRPKTDTPDDGDEPR